MPIDLDPVDLVKILAQELVRLFGGVSPHQMAFQPPAAAPLGQQYIPGFLNVLLGVPERRPPWLFEHDLQIAQERTALAGRAATEQGRAMLERVIPGVAHLFPGPLGFFRPFITQQLAGIGQTFGVRAFTEPAQQEAAAGMLAQYFPHLQGNVGGIIEAFQRQGLFWPGPGHEFPVFDPRHVAGLAGILGGWGGTLRGAPAQQIIDQTTQLARAMQIALPALGTPDINTALQISRQITGLPLERLHEAEPLLLRLAATARVHNLDPQFVTHTAVAASQLFQTLGAGPLAGTQQALNLLNFPHQLLPPELIARVGGPEGLLQFQLQRAGEFAVSPYVRHVGGLLAIGEEMGGRGGPALRRLQRAFERGEVTPQLHEQALRETERRVARRERISMAQARELVQIRIAIGGEGAAMQAAEIGLEGQVAAEWQAFARRHPDFARREDLARDPYIHFLMEEAKARGRPITIEQARVQAEKGLLFRFNKREWDKQVQQRRQDLDNIEKQLGKVVPEEKEKAEKLAGGAQPGNLPDALLKLFTDFIEHLKLVLKQVQELLGIPAGEVSAHSGVLRHDTV